MPNEPIALTDRDLNRLSKMVDRMRFRSDRDLAQCLDTLEHELSRAEIVPAEAARPDIVTMDSRVEFHDIDSGEELVYTVTWPELADSDEAKVSVLAPIGMALLGARVGQVISWQVPAGTRRFRIDAVLYQPEASGVFDVCN